MDSYYKYKHLKNKKFDLVVFYHGINEVRANYVERKDFKDDYSHFYWYAVLSALNSHPEHPFIVLPFTLHYSYLTFAKMFSNEPKHVREMPRPHLLDHGSDIKSVIAFEKNLANLIQLARDRNTKFLLMSFATDTPEGGYPEFSAERYEKVYDHFNKYYVSRGCCPIEIWGKAEHVLDGIEAHNRVIHKVAERNPDVLFIDHDKNMSNQHHLFSDVCHLNRVGTDLFVQSMLANILPEKKRLTVKKLISKINAILPEIQST